MPPMIGYEAGDLTLNIIEALASRNRACQTLAGAIDARSPSKDVSILYCR